MIEILYENNDIVFCVKPVGLSSESELPVALSEQLSSEVYALHRLDTPVGGVMVYAKNKPTAERISRKIAERTDFTKSYLAVCEGAFDEKEGCMEDLLFKDSRENKSYIVKNQRKGVKKARLTYDVVGCSEYKDKMCSLVLVHLDTGRSHQIRVQFAGRKHPLLGDGKYGSKVNCPLALHSYKIETEGLSFSKKPSDTLPWNIFYEIEKLP